MVDEHIPFAMVLEAGHAAAVAAVASGPGPVEIALRRSLLSGQHDFLYLQRQADRAVPETVVDAALGLVAPDRSWGFHAYVITLSGAMKLLHRAVYAHSIVAPDLYLQAVISVSFERKECALYEYQMNRIVIQFEVRCILTSTFPSVRAV